MDLDKAEMLARQAAKKKEKVHLTIRTKYAILCQLDESPLSNADFAQSWNEMHDPVEQKSTVRVDIDRAKVNRSDRKTPHLHKLSDASGVTSGFTTLA